MADVTTFIESNFVIATPEWNQKKVVLIAPPEFVQNTNNKYAGTKNLIGTIQNEGRQFQLGINKTNAKRLAAAWGTDTLKWVGKIILVETAMTMIKGEVQRTILLTPTQ